MSLRLDLLEVDDPRWDPAARPDDPYGNRLFQAAQARVLGQRPMLLRSEAASYVLLLLPTGDGRWLARTPEYGGPHVERPEVLAEVRRGLDEQLAELGVVSEVAVLGPDLPHRSAVLDAWSATTGNEVCVTDLGRPDRWADLPKGRRSDVNRARRELDVDWSPLDASGAQRFASDYAEAMVRKDAPARWRLGLEYFQALADRPGPEVHIATATGPDGRAMALFLRDGAAATYLYATRRGSAPGGASAVLWRAMDELAAAGVESLLLGGGTTGAPDDPLLAFKRSFATRTARIGLAARVFDRAGHEAAVDRGAARPLPEGAVAP